MVHFSAYAFVASREDDGCYDVQVVRSVCKHVLEKVEMTAVGWIEGSGVDKNLIDLRFSK